MFIYLKNFAFEILIFFFVGNEFELMQVLYAMEQSGEREEIRWYCDVCR